MDPNLFHVDMERLFEVLVTIVVLSFFVERALSLVFENRFFVHSLSGRGIKELIAFLCAFAVCWKWDFDAISVILVAEKTNHIGQAVTAAVIAGGSKAAIKFFHDVLGAMSTAEQERRGLRMESAVVKASGTGVNASVTTSVGSKHD